MYEGALRTLNELPGTVCKIYVSDLIFYQPYIFLQNAVEFGYNVIKVVL
jgi:hypothetical protein